MYSRPNRSKDLRVPLNYGGSAFMRTPSFPSAAEDPPPKEHIGRQYDTRSQKKLPPQMENTDIEEIEKNEDIVPHKDTCEHCEQCKDMKYEVPKEEKRSSLFPAINSISSEDLLLIALALMIFQGEKEPELALILLALLFIK